MSKVPWSLVFSQLLNGVLLVGLAIFFLRKKVFLFFRKREGDFLKQQKESENLLLKARRENETVRLLLKRAEKNYEKEIERARKSAQSKGELLSREAQEKAQEILREGEIKMKREEERILKMVQKALVSQSFKKAKEKLKAQSSEEKKRAFEFDFLKHFS